MELREALTLAEQELAELERQRSRINVQIEELSVEVESLKRTMKRRGVALDETQGRRHQAFQEMPRTEIIEMILAEASGPMSPNEIVALLTNLGRNDEYGAVSAALAHLARTDRAHTVGRGNWRRGPSPRRAQQSLDRKLAVRPKRSPPPHNESEEPRVMSGARSSQKEVVPGGDSR